MLNERTNIALKYVLKRESAPGTDTLDNSAIDVPYLKRLKLFFVGALIPEL